MNSPVWCSTLILGLSLGLSFGATLPGRARTTEVLPAYLEAPVVERCPGGEPAGQGGRDHPEPIGHPPTDDTLRRLADSPRDEYAASLVKLQNGDLLAAYDRWNAASNFGWKMVTRSTNNGVTWSAPESVISGDLKAWPRLSQTADGTVWMFYRDWRHPPSYDTSYISYLKSTNNGRTWLPEQQLPIPRTGRKYGGYSFQPAGNLLWVFYTVQNPGAAGYDIYYCSSTDNGSTWTETPFLEADGTQNVGEVFRDRLGRIWVLYTTGDTTFYRTTSDTGRTWSDTLRLPYGATSFATVDQTGKIWMVTGQAFGSYNTDVYYFTSTDDGATWTNNVRVTRFAGMDRASDVAIVNGSPWLFWHSDRMQNGDIFYGVLGSISDGNPPPYFAPYYWPNPRTNPDGPRLGQAFAPNGCCTDESGIRSVTLVYSVNGQQKPDLELYDDGSHGDFSRGDSWYGNWIGPYSGALATIVCQFRIVDIDNNTVLAPPNPWLCYVAGVHDTSNLQLYISPVDGSDGSRTNNAIGPYPSCEWPAHSGDHYLFGGHAWVGVADQWDTLVDCGYDPNNGLSNFRVCAGDTLRYWTGLSDWDSRIRIDDDGIPQDSQIGIEVTKHSLSWHHWRYGDFIIQEYVIKNPDGNGNLTGVHVGFCHDFDIPTNAAQNLAGTDTARSMCYMFNPSGNRNGYIGVRVLSHRPRCLSWWTIPTDPTNEGAKFRCLTSSSYMGNATTPADYRVFESVEPINIREGDSVKIVVGIVIGAGLAELQRNADEMKRLYDRGYLPGIEQSPATSAGLTFKLDPIEPNPMHSSASVRYQIPSSGPVTLRIYDPTGRTARTLVDCVQKSGGYRVYWDGNDDLGSTLTNGIYFCRLEAASQRREQKLILVR